MAPCVGRLRYGAARVSSICRHRRHRGRPGAGTTIIGGARQAKSRQRGTHDGSERCQGHVNGGGDAQGGGERPCAVMGCDDVDARAKAYRGESRTMDGSEGL